MNCIFCHKSSDSSKSIEHIVPESLGNKGTFLWRGAVCDKCNNYFAVKIERGLLEQPYFVSVRHRNFIYTKKNHNVKDQLLFNGPNGGWVNTQFNLGDENLIISFDENDELYKSLQNGKIKNIIIPIFPEPEPDNYLLSRFLTKCALEYFVLRVKQENFVEFSDYLRTFPEINMLRKYARYGEGDKFWPYHQRRIYGEGDLFTDRNRLPHQVLCEMDLLIIQHETKVVDGEEYVVAEYYYVLVIMGIEYVINIAGPEIEGYEAWLEKHSNQSPIEINDTRQRMPVNYSNWPIISEELAKKIKKN